MLVHDNLHGNDDNNKEKLQQIFTVGDNNKNYTTVPEIMNMKLNLINLQSGPQNEDWALKDDGLSAQPS